MLNINFRSPKTKKILLISGIVLICLLGLIIGIIVNLSNQKPVEKIDYVSLGNTALAKFQYTVSAQFFQQAIVQDKTDLSAYLALAKVYEIKNKTDLAIQVLESGVDNVTDNTQIIIKLIDNYILLGNKDKTLDLTKKLLMKLANNNSQNSDIAKYILIQFEFEKLSNFEQAKINLSKNVVDFDGKISGNNAEQIYLNLALIEWKNSTTSKHYLAKINYESQKEKIDYMISLLDKYEKNQDEVSLNIARLMINDELATPALDLSSEFIKNNPEYSGGYLVRGIAEFKLGKLDESKTDLIKSYQLDPSAISQTYLAKIYESQNLTQQSADAYEKALAIEPNNLTTYKNYAEMLYRANLFSQSVLIYQKLIDKSEHNSETFANYLRLCEILFYKSNNFQTLYETSDKLTRFWNDISEYKVSEGLITFYKLWSEYQVNLLKPENAQSLAFYTNMNRSLFALDTSYPNTAIINYHIGLVLNSAIKLVTDQATIDDLSKTEKSYFQKAMELDNSGNFATKAQDFIKNLN